MNFKHCFIRTKIYFREKNSSLLEKKSTFISFHFPSDLDFEIIFPSFSFSSTKYRVK